MGFQDFRVYYFFYIKYQTIFIAVIIPASFSTIFFLKHQLLSHFPHFQLFFLLNTNTIQVTKKTPLYPQYSEYPIAHKLFHLQVQMDLCLLVFLRPAMLTFSKRLLVMVQSLLACKIYYQWLEIIKTGRQTYLVLPLLLRHPRSERNIRSPFHSDQRPEGGLVTDMAVCSFLATFRLSLSWMSENTRADLDRLAWWLVISLVDLRRDMTWCCS